jgi:PAS domain S-box-containing protein
VIRNLTELKEAEEKFRAFVETAPQAIIIHDAKGKIVVVNSEAEHIFGYRRQELIGQPVEILIPARFRGKHVEERQAYMRKPIIRPMGSGLELSAQRKDGSEFPVEISLSPVETAEGVLVSSTIVDITERKRHEEQTRWATILEERARMARDIHDTLAQGFTGIILNLEAAEEACADLPKEARDRIARARDVARSGLEEARRSVLALSSPLPVNDDLIGAIRALVNHSRLSTKTQLEFSTRGTAVRLARRVAEDLLRIIQQAVDNALKHARASSIRIELAFNRKEVQLQIKDDGKGFDVRKARRGVGLIGMRERAKEIGGKFTLNSKPGKGTRVEVTVPLRPPEVSR